MSTVKLSQLRIMPTLVTFLLVITANDVNCQKIDSLEVLLNGATGSARYKMLFSLGYEHVDINDVIALRYAALAFKESQQNNDSLNIVQSGRLLSLVFRRLGEIDSSIIVSMRVLPIARRNKFMKEVRTVINGLALAYTHKAYYDKALDHYFEALSLEDNMGDNNSKGVVLNNVGLVYYKMADYQKALSYFNEALKLHSMAKLKNNLNTFYVNIALCNSYLGNFTEAMNNVSLAVAACKAGCSDLETLQTRYCQGVLHYKLDELLKAESRFLDSYLISKKLGNKRFQLDNIVYLAEIYVKLNQLPQAERYLAKSEVLIASGLPYNLELIKIYKELFGLNTKLGDHRKASYYLWKYSQLKDSIYSAELTTNLMKIEANYLERENNSRIEAQNKILTLDKEVIFRQRIINVSVGVVAVLLTVLSFMLIQSNRRKRLMNRLLELKVKERTIELEQNQLTLLKALDERTLQFRRLSIDVKSSIATIKGLCSLAIIESKNDDPDQYLGRIEETAERIIGDLKGVAF